MDYEFCVVYTAITGGFRNKLHPVPAGAATARFVCFTDGLRSLVPPGWEVRPCAWEHRNDPRRTSRWHKIHGTELFPNAEWTLWHDGNQQLLVDPQTVIQKHPSWMTCYKHPDRNCIYDELQTCIALKKDNPEVMRQQVARYEQAGYPKNNGLIETTAIVRHRDTATRRLEALWWDEVASGSLRDQLSLNYCLWKLGLTPSIMPGNRVKSPYFRYHAHR